ncbi:MAG: primosomal protein N' [Bacteroidales bacterium]|nr:primosomal protein N' [Bacteroidales bacterium]
MMRYAEVILPLPLQGTFTYSVPVDMSSRVRAGSRVVVPFGRKKYYTGIVRNLTDVAPGSFEVKEIGLLLDDGLPVVKRPQMQFWEWIAEYYLSGVGDVYKAAVPAGLKIESETFIEIAPDYREAAEQVLSERESMIVQALDHAGKSVSVAEVEKMTGLKGVGASVGPLLNKGAVIISEKLVERYTPKRIRCVRLNCEPGDKSSLHKMFDSVHGAPKQEKALLALVELSDFNRGESKEVTVASLKERAEVSPAILTALSQKGIVEFYYREINRFKYNGLPVIAPPRLSEAQAVALDEIHKSWMNTDVTLLHGVTSSGKTEIYIHLIDFVLRQGRQVLFLVPEIALTTQLTGRIQRVFGDKVVVYHSKFSDNERVDIWRKMLEETEPCVVIGARSAIFLPFDNLGLVIVDEEHDSSYKQAEPAPRYNARDAAMVLARMHGAKVLLGSATPAVDTYYKASSGKYGLVSLTERYGNAVMPEVEIIDTNRERQKGLMSGAIAKQSRENITAALKRGEQGIVFINRRGFAPVAVCSRCGYTPRCERCDVALTYHKSIDTLVCHYCGSKYPLHVTCPACKEPAVKVVGYGTERVEEEIENEWKDVSVARMDLDSTRAKDGHAGIIEDFSSGKSRLLVGTQMVTKGLDFGGVGAVAVLNSDALVNSPDFRSAERAFNTISQVAGRAGRRGETSAAKVTVQTAQPNHPVYPFIAAHDYSGFFNYEIGQRQAHSYPPFTRLIHIYIKHRDSRTADNIAAAYKQRLSTLFGNRVLGPQTPAVSRIQSLYIRKIMLKIEVEASMKKVREILRKVFIEFHESSLSGIRSAVVYYDVDPC